MTVVRQSWRCRSLIGISIYSSNYHYAQIMFVRMFSSVTLQAENGTAFGSQSMLYLINGRREIFVINTMLMRLSSPSIFQNEITYLYKLFTSLQINMTKKSQSEILICWMFLGFTKRSCLKTTSCLQFEHKNSVTCLSKTCFLDDIYGMCLKKIKKLKLQVKILINNFFDIFATSNIIQKREFSLIMHHVKTKYYLASTRKVLSSEVAFYFEVIKTYLPNENTSCFVIYCFTYFLKSVWYLWVIGLPIQKGWGRDLFLEYFRLSLEEFIDIFFGFTL